VLAKQASILHRWITFKASFLQRRLAVEQRIREGEIGFRSSNCSIRYLEGLRACIVALALSVV
jgi:hypothetical protein